MLAMRWPSAVADAVSSAIASRGPSVCAVCRAWGRGRIAEVAGVLTQAGAATVEIWVLARTPRPGDA